jgi:hypothetical protein
VENVLEVELEGMKFSKTLIVPSTSSSPTLFLAGYGDVPQQYSESFQMSKTLDLCF